jgi:hypothetical protein
MLLIKSSGPSKIGPWLICSRRGGDVTSVILSVYYARISVQDGYVYRYDGQCTICTAFSSGMFQRVTHPVHTVKFSHVPRVPPHAPSPHGLGDHSCHVNVIMMLCIMILCIISCIYGTHAASSSSHCLTSLYFFFFFVIITYSLPYHDSYRRSDVTCTGARSGRFQSA